MHYIVTVDATHAGFINGNNTWYLEDHMKAAVDTWITPYNRPVLRHHEYKSDAIGYVIDAKYISTPSGAGVNKPKGHIQLTAIISDKDAVQKIQDRRYNTVSISADAAYARCSICNQKISEDGLCEHTRGKTYEKKKCFWYIGGLKYKEVSYVNAPADEYARTVRIEEKETDGMAIQESTKDNEKTVNVRFSFADSDEPTVTVVEDKEADWTDFTEDDLEMAHWLMVEMNNEMAEDAKISTAKRKKLSGSTFCGPNRSFPVPDCAHVTAARRLIGRYKGPGDKSRILACVSRKAKSMGCGGGKKNSDSQGDVMAELTLSEIIARDDVKEYIKAEVTKEVKDKDSQLSALTALDEKVKKQEGEIKAKDKEITSLKENTTNLEKDNEELRTKVHQNMVDKVYDMRVSLQKKEVMDLKNDKEVEAYKAELSKRSDESLTDTISDLQKEDPVAPTAKEIKQSQPDSTEVTDENKDEKQTKTIKSVDPTERAKEVKDFIFAEEKAQSKDK
jgi:hypothetical protein